MWLNAMIKVAFADWDDQLKIVAVLSRDLQRNALAQRGST